jgi:hypothetical protein
VPSSSNTSRRRMLNMRQGLLVRRCPPMSADRAGAAATAEQGRRAPRRCA